MVRVEAGEFNDMACLWLGNGRVRLAVTTDRGPRAVFWGWDGGANLFAELPDFVVRGYHFLGGHRLWYAPESFERTYQADDRPVEVERAAGGARFRAAPDSAGVVKEMRFELDAAGPVATVTHLLHNLGRQAVELAPWALSMCRLGGVALLPQPRGPADPDGLLPNRSFSLWPYSDLADPRLILGNAFVLVDARPAPPNKVGYFCRDGWLAYWLDGTLFGKRFDPRPDAAHPDGGCNAECYLNDRFIELETLGPVARLAAGETAVHVETWRLDADVPRPAGEAEAAALAARLGLATG